MTENYPDLSEPGRVELTSMQRQVVEILKSVEYKNSSLADWYLGALYAAKNMHNPDRFAQAAQSLRELLEKLPRIFVESEVLESRSGLPEMRRTLYLDLSSAKERYAGSWKDKLIDPELEKTLEGFDRYLELSQMPTRKDQIHSVMSKIDPMHDVLAERIKLEKSERFRSVWSFFETVAHHKTPTNEESFWHHLLQTERIVVDLLAPITAQDQSTIRAILKKPQPEDEDIPNLLELIKRRGANYAYFFKTVDNPVWITPLSENGFFNNPPALEAAADGRWIIPFWLPILYLRRVCYQSPTQAVEIILDLKQTDNPRILMEIVSIACDLKDIGFSLRLKPLVWRFLKSPYRRGGEEIISKIIHKWGSNQSPYLDAPIEIMRYVLAFQSDPRQNEKVSRRKEDPEARDTLLQPVPRFDQWSYDQILKEGVRPLAEREPYKVSRTLIDAVASMIGLGMHPEVFERGSDEDFSEIWCRRLNRFSINFNDPKATLVQTLTFACEQVYQRAAESIDALDQALRKRRWRVFQRLRQHLYASYPNDQTLPWIRKQLLDHGRYSKSRHHFEFQLMIRRASALYTTQAFNMIHKILSNAAKIGISSDWGNVCSN